MYKIELDEKQMAALISALFDGAYNTERLGHAFEDKGYHETGKSFVDKAKKHTKILNEIRRQKCYQDEDAKREAERMKWEQEGEWVIRG